MPGDDQDEPESAVLLLRRMFASGGADVARKLRAHAPAAVERVLDEPYGEDMVLDVYRPSTTEDAPPTVVWVHGGGWIGGSTEELSIYFEIIASNGYAVVGPRYSLEPEQRIGPTPVIATSSRISGSPRCRWRATYRSRSRLR